MSERQLTAIAKIESMKLGIKMMKEGGDISHLASVFLNTDLDNLYLQIKNINLPEKESEK